MPNDLKPLLDGLDRLKRVSLQGHLDGLKGAAAGVTLDMRQSPAHGDVTGASHANYAAYAVGLGETGTTEFNRAVRAVETLNPGHSARSSVAVKGIGVVITSATDYQDKLETENAGQKAVLTPTVQASGTRFTQAAASGSKRALS